MVSFIGAVGIFSEILLGALIKVHTVEGLNEEAVISVISVFVGKTHSIILLKELYIQST